MLGLLALGLIAGCRPPKKHSAVVVIRTPKQLWQEYEANPLQVEDMVKGKRVRVTGKLLSIDFNPDTKEVVLVMAGELDAKHFLLFLLPDSRRSQALKLRTKLTVTLEGKLYKAFDDQRTSSFGLSFDDASVVK